MRLFHFTMNYCGSGMIIISTCARGDDLTLSSERTNTDARRAADETPLQNTKIARSIEIIASDIYRFRRRPACVKTYESARLQRKHNRAHVCVGEMKRNSVDFGSASAVFGKNHRYVRTCFAR